MANAQTARLHAERVGTVDRFMGGLPTYGPSSQVPLPQPTLTSVAPNTAALDDADITGIFTGTNFTEDSIIVWNGVDEPTTLISPTQVSTIIKPSVVTSPYTAKAAVRNGAKITATVDFVFTEPLPDPPEGEAARSRRR